MLQQFYRNPIGIAVLVPCVILVLMNAWKMLAARNQKQNILAGYYGWKITGELLIALGGWLMFLHPNTPLGPVIMIGIGVWALNRPPKKYAIEPPVITKANKIDWQANLKKAKPGRKADKVHKL